MAFVNQQQQQQQRQGGFKRKRNNNAEVPESSSKIKKRIRDINRTLNKKNKVKKHDIAIMITDPLSKGHSFSTSYYRIKEKVTYTSI